jgi:hypothetical protein
VIVSAVVDILGYLNYRTFSYFRQSFSVIAAITAALTNTPNTRLAVLLLGKLIRIAGLAFDTFDTLIPAIILGRIKAVVIEATRNIRISFLVSPSFGRGSGTCPYCGVGAGVGACIFCSFDLTKVTALRTIPAI